MQASTAELAKPRVNIQQTAAYFAAFVCLGAFFASLGPTLPSLAENTQSAVSAISFLFVARSLGYLLGALEGGRLYDKIPGNKLMAGVLILMAAMMVLVPLFGNLVPLVGVLLILGVASGALDVGTNTMLIWAHGAKSGAYMNAGHFFFGMGSFLSPIIIAQLVLKSGGITWPYWVLGALFLPVAVWLLRLPSPAGHSVPEGSTAERRNNVLVFLVALFLFLYAGAEVAFSGWVYSYAVALGLANETTAAYLTSTFWGALAISALVAVPIAFRYRPRYILMGDFVIGFTSMSIILLWPASTIALWVGTFGLGLSFATMFPTALSLAERRMKITGKVSRWFFVGAGLGGMMLPWSIGQVFETVGPQVTMTAIFFDLVLTLVVFLVMLRFAPVRGGNS